MAISTKDTIHGAAILNLTEQLSKEKNLFFSFLKGKSNSSYTFQVIKTKPSVFTFNNGNLSLKKIGLYIKTSNKRNDPWRYTFSKENQEEIENLKSSCEKTFVLLALGKEGFALLEYNDLKKLLDDNFEDTEWLSVEKPVNKFFRINGKDGKQKLKVPQNNFPSFIVKEAKTLMK